MARRSIAVTGRADPATAWVRYVEPARWASWSPQIRSVDYPFERLRPASIGVVHGVCGIDVPFEVLAVDGEDRSWTWRVTAPLGIRMTLVHGVQDDAAGVRTTLDVDGPAPVVLAYVPISRVALARLVR